MPTVRSSRLLRAPLLTPTAFQITVENTTSSGEPVGVPWRQPQLTRRAFNRWAGANTNDGSQFYKSQATINLFKAYIKVLLNRVNQFTGVRGSTQRLKRLG